MGPASTRMLAGLGLSLAAWLPGGCVDESDKISWYVVSNPTFDDAPVHGGLIVSWRSSDKSTGVLRLGGGSSGSGSALAGRLGTPSTQGRAALYVLEETGGPDGRDASNERDILLGIDSDFAVVSTRSTTQLFSPALPGGAMTVPGAITLAPVPDSATALQVTTTDGGGTTYHFATAGNLVWEERRDGLLAWLPDSAPQRFPAGSRLEADGAGYRVVEPTRRITTMPVPPGVVPGSQYVVIDGGDTARFFDPEGRVAAQLPNGQLTRHRGDDGTILQGDFPRGTGNLDDPFRAVLLRGNRRLLLIRRE